jgi:hypothetical protein
MLVALYRKYVSFSGDLDVSRLRAVILRESRAAEHGKIKVSRDLLRELRNDRAVVGRLAKRCTRRQR